MSERLTMTMTSWHEDGARKMRARVLGFFKAHPNARFLLCIHTHADSSTGQLCNSYNADRTVALYNTIEEVCDYFLGKEIIAALKRRTALRGLLLLACGSSMGPNHVDSVKALVRRYVWALLIFC